MWWNIYVFNRVSSIIFGLVIFLIANSGLAVTIHKKKYKGSEDWKVHTTRAFNIYYAGDDQSLAEKAGDILEEEFDKITEFLGFIPSRESDIYLVPEENPDDLKIPKSLKYGSVKDSSGNLRKALIREFTGVVIHEMYGKKGIRQLDPWFYKGIIAYVVDKDSVWDRMDQKYLDQDVLKSLDKDEAMEVGKYIWKYLVKMNGEDIVAYVLNSARLLEDEIPVEQITGVSFENLLNGCKKYYF